MIIVVGFTSFDDATSSDTAGGFNTHTGFGLVGVRSVLALIYSRSDADGSDRAPSESGAAGANESFGISSLFVMLFDDLSFTVGDVSDSDDDVGEPCCNIFTFVYVR